jgi:hypothetical protein
MCTQKKEELTVQKLINDRGCMAIFMVNWLVISLISKYSAVAPGIPRQRG